jgi:hypothetical protein
LRCGKADDFPIGVPIRSCHRRVGHGRFALAREMARSAHRGSRIARHDLADHEPVKSVTDLGPMLLMIDVDSVLVQSSFQAITCSGDTRMSDVKPICWQQAINSPTSCG